MLEVKHLYKSFGNNEILSDLNFSVKKGEVVAILGPSGSGKTTLLRCLSFLEPADSGEMKLGRFDIDLAKAGKTEIRNVRMDMGFVFQNFNLFRNMTAKENVCEGLITARKMDKAEAEAIALKMLEKVGMSDRANYYPDELSGGQQQRVAIARAIAPSPDIIFFDEPTSALDPELTGEVLDTMTLLAKDGITMVVVTHEMEFAKNVADTIIFMEDSKIVEIGSAKDMFENPKEARTAEFLKKYITK